jgi:hypothetical protein
LVYESKSVMSQKKFTISWQTTFSKVLGTRWKKDGSKEKTYEFAKKLFGELKDLRGQRFFVQKTQWWSSWKARSSVEVGRRWKVHRNIRKSQTSVGIGKNNSINKIQLQKTEKRNVPKEQLLSQY